MTISLSTNSFKISQLTSGGIDLLSDVIKARIGSNSDLVAVAPSMGTMTPVQKYLGSTDQICVSPNVLITAPGGFDAPSTVAFDCADMTFPAIAADAGKEIDWICIFQFISNDATSIPLWFLTGFTPIVPAASPITVQFAGTNNRLYGLT